VACPFFMPIEKLENGSWPHTHRLPLGCGWSGHCSAPQHEGEIPSPDELREFCNLGYAEGCTRLPRERSWDSVRFGARTITKTISGGSNAGMMETGMIHLRYVCERDHRPVEHGLLEFDPAHDRWPKPHADHRVQRMAECFLTAYFEKRKRQAEPAAR
jgi:hypothetical protein